MNNKINLKNLIRTRREILSGLIPLFAKFLILMLENIFKAYLVNILKMETLFKIIYRNNIKISYSFTNNISIIMNNHNQKLINKLK